MLFWDEHIGVFVETPASGIVEARSRVFPTSETRCGRFGRTARSSAPGSARR